MFQGWRVRVACLKVGERVEIPSDEFRCWDALKEGTKLLSFQVELFGKYYELTAWEDSLWIERKA